MSLTVNYCGRIIREENFKEVFNDLQLKNVMQLKKMPVGSSIAITFHTEAYDVKKVDPTEDQVINSIITHEGPSLFPNTFLKAKTKMLFIHKHGDLDLVKQGQDLLCRGNCTRLVKKSLMKIMTPKKVPVGHVFIGIVGSREIANAYVYESTDTYALVGSMSSESI